MKKRIKITLITLCALSPLMLLSSCTKHTKTAEPKIRVISSLNFYGETAKSILGKYGTVDSIIKSDVDPHDFEPTTNDAKAVAKSNVIITNGLGYDGWMEELIKNDGGGDHHVINVGSLMHKHDGDNEHVWYDPNMTDRLVNDLVQTYSKIDPAHRQEFVANGQHYKKTWDKNIYLLSELSRHSDGKQVAVSEPVFDYSLEAMHYKIADNGFANAIDKGVDPSIKDISSLQSEIKHHKIAFFVNNTQASSPVVSDIVKLAKKNHIPIVNVSETEPKGQTYFEWMNSQYRQVEKIQQGKQK